jgi:hypothetical protein
MPPLVFAFVACVCCLRLLLAFVVCICCLRLLFGSVRMVTFYHTIYETKQGLHQLGAALDKRYMNR